MKMRQEIDAMTVMGLDTYEVLVIPRAIACVIAMPILTFLAMMSGLKWFACGLGDGGYLAYLVL